MKILEKPFLFGERKETNEKYYRDRKRRKRKDGIKIIVEALRSFFSDDLHIPFFFFNFIARVSKYSYDVIIMGNIQFPINENNN